MGLNKKSNEKYFEKDPFLVPISNNNTAFTVHCCEEKQKLKYPGKLGGDAKHCLSFNLMLWKSD